MYAKTSVYICMLLDGSGLPMGAEVIQASNLAQAIDGATELLNCCTLPAKALGYELWNRGRKLATWQYATA